MKKITKFLMFMCIATSVDAQYFTREYGSTSNTDVLRDGAPAAALPVGEGHLITGTTSFLGTRTLTLTRTDIAGDISAGCFSSIYELQNAAGDILAVDVVKVIEVPSGVATSNIMVTGTYTDDSPQPVEFGVFIAMFNALGNVLYVTGYTQDVNSEGRLSMVSACPDLGGGPIVYCLGNIDLTLRFGQMAGQGIFTIGFNTSNFTTVYTQIYNISNNYTRRETAADIIASPWNPTQLAVIGNYDASAGGPGSYLLRVDKATGNVIGNVRIYNYANSTETVKSITLASTPGSVGFMICGSSNNGNGAIQRVWVFKVNPLGVAGAALPKNFINYSVANAGNYIGTDITERLNTLGDYEYYASATIFNGSIGMRDLVIIKLDDLLEPSALSDNEFTYGKANSNELSEEIVSFNSGLAPGIAIYGNTTQGDITGNREMYVVKAYYNGALNCSEDTTTTTFANSPNLMGTTPAAALGPLVEGPLTSEKIGSLSMYPICNVATYMSGSNLRLSQEDPTTTISPIQVWPNPVLAGASGLQINLYLPADEQVQFRIIDINGREIVNQTITVSEGNSTQNIVLPSYLVDP
jgi:hypothetical protein